MARRSSADVMVTAITDTNNANIYFHEKKNDIDIMLLCLHTATTGPIYVITAMDVCLQCLM